MALDPLISIIMSTHNRPNLLQERSIPSVLRQTHQNWELLIRGDGADERTESVINSFNDSRIKYKNLPRRQYSNPREQWCWGGAQAQNKALEDARGTYIAYLDDDDEFLPHHLNTLSKMLITGDYNFVYGRVYKETTDGWTVLGEPFDKTRLMKTNYISNSAVMYDRAHLGHFRHDMKPRDEPGDWVLWKKMVTAGAHVGFTQEIVALNYAQTPLKRYDAEFKVRVEQIRTMQLQAELNTIRGSFIYRLMHSITTRIDTIFPDGTRRGRIRQKLIARLSRKACG